MGGAGFGNGIKCRGGRDAVCFLQGVWFQGILDTARLHPYYEAVDIIIIIEPHRFSVEF